MRQKFSHIVVVLVYPIEYVGKRILVPFSDSEPSRNLSPQLRDFMVVGITEKGYNTVNVREWIFNRGLEYEVYWGCQGSMFPDQWLV